MGLLVLGPAGGFVLITLLTFKSINTFHHILKQLNHFITKSVTKEHTHVQTLFALYYWFI